MTSLTHGYGAVSLPSRQAPTVTQTWHESLTTKLANVASAMAQRRYQRRDGEIGRFIQANGGTLTDDLERQISRRFGSIVG